MSSAEASEPRQATAKRTCSRRRRTHAGSARAGAGPPRTNRPPPSTGTVRRWARRAARWRARRPSGPPAAGSPVCRADLEHAEHHQRPHQVELLLDRQRPRVQQRRRLGGQREVARARMNGVPVRDVEDRRERVAEDVGGGQDPGHDGQDDADDGDEEEQRGQEAPGATGPEASEANRSGARPLLDQQGRDQESGQDEERIDAVETPGHRAEPGVEGDDGQHRKGPDAIEPANAAQPRVPPGCVSVRVHAASGPTVPGGVPPLP